MSDLCMAVSVTKDILQFLNSELNLTKSKIPHMFCQLNVKLAPAPPAALSHCLAAGRSAPALTTGELSWKTEIAIFKNAWHLYNMADIDNKNSLNLFKIWMMLKK